MYVCTVCTYIQYMSQDLVIAAIRADQEILYPSSMQLIAANRLSLWDHVDWASHAPPILTTRLANYIPTLPTFRLTTTIRCPECFGGLTLFFLPSRGVSVLKLSRSIRGTYGHVPGVEREGKLMFNKLREPRLSTARECTKDLT